MFTWLTEWFVLWSLSFWLLLGAEIIVLVLCLADDLFEGEMYTGKATFSLLICLALLQFLGKIPIFQTLVAHPGLSFLYLGLYVLAGALYMVVKWARYVSLQVRAYQQEVRDEFVKEHNIKGEIPAELKMLLRDKLKKEIGRSSDSSLRAPQVSEHKELLFGWFAFWPASALWTAISDPIRSLFESIYHHFREMLQGISDRLWRKVLIDTGLDKSE